MIKIAIIEDDRAIAKMYQMKFAQAGYQVELTDNGSSGLALCQQMQPDIVLLDLMMPGMSGQEMLEKMRGTDWGKKLLVMALTNLSRQEANLKLGESGFDDYAVKAYYTPAQLFEKVNILLKENGKLPKK